MQHADEILANAVRGLRLQSVARKLMPYAPRWIRRLDVKRKVRLRRRLVWEEELAPKYRDAIERLRCQNDKLGDYLEFGVYNGTSLSCMYRVLDEFGIRDVRLFGFDSFEGLPDFARTDSGGHWRPGEFESTYEFAKQVLDDAGVNWNRVVLVKGLFADTLNEEVRQTYNIRRASVIMVDCDLYQSAKEALDFCAPLIQDQTVIFFDDWYPLANRNQGEKLAFDEFLQAHPQFDVQELYDFKPWGKVFLVSRASG